MTDDEGGCSDGLRTTHNVVAVMAYTHRGYANNELVWQKEG